MPLISEGAESQRLLPSSLEDRMIRLVGRAGGVALLISVGILWLALMTWVVSDPSFSNATTGPVKNWAGATGALFSDLLLQMLGLAAVIMLLAPMFWGLELVLAEQISSFRSKAMYFPLAVLLLAGAASSMPASENWPLYHGHGGILGDLVLRVVTWFVSLATPNAATFVSGLLLVLLGLPALAHSIGLELRDLRDLLRSDAEEAADAARTEPGWYDRIQGEMGRLKGHFSGSEGYAQAAAGYADPAYAEPFAEHDWSTGRAEPTLAPGGEHMPAYAPPQMQAAPSGAPYAGYGRVPAPWGETGGMPAAAVPMHPVSPYGEAAFDDETPSFAHSAFTGLPSSRDIAQRFAPRSASTATASVAAPVEVAMQPEAFAQPPHMMGDMSHQPQPDAHAAREPLPSVPHPAQAQHPQATALMRGLKFRQQGPRYQRPSLNLLKRPSGPKPGLELTQTALRGNARLLEDVLSDFGVKGEVKDVKPGPVVTLFELEPARGTKSSRVIALADDIARSMSATSARVAVVPGRNAIGIELPNQRREPVLLREILESEAFRNSGAALPIALGKSIGGEPVVADLSRMPHLLVAGTTGSGKSVGVNAMILSLLYRHTPEDCRFIMIDPKMLELSVYNGIPHLLAPVVTDPMKAINALNWVVGEMEERYKRMSKLSVRNIDVFNNRVRNAKKRGEAIARTVQTGYDGHTGAAIYEREELSLEPMPYIVVVVDEFADLMVVAGKEIEAAVQRLAQMARAAGIHLIMATQRPSVDIITGTIKANFPTRISFKVTSKIDSRTILNEQGAEQLLGQGDMLYSSGSGQTARVHGPFVADEEVEAIAAALRASGPPQYTADILDGPDGGAAGDEHPGGDSGDDMFDRAVAIVIRDQKASTSYLQRRLGIGYNRAADLMERMEKEGLVSPAGPTGKREILAGPRN